MLTGAVISDLHKFTQRSSYEAYEEELHRILKNTNVLVLNGDIIDFRWSVFPSAKATVEATKEWLQSLLSQYPHLEIYYILGNHDAYLPLTDMLEALAQAELRFHWHPTHWQAGDTLFIHGDLPLKGKNPFHRYIEPTTKKAATPLHTLYDIAIVMKMHRVSDVIHARNRCVRKISRVLDAYQKNLPEPVRHVYFGHTHVPFTDYAYGNYIFHNTGGVVHGVRNHILQMRLALPTTKTS